MRISSPVYRIATAALVAALALAGAACSSEDDDEAAESQSTTTAVAVTTTIAVTTTVAPNKLTIQGFQFMGVASTKANTPWSITNADSVVHTVTAVDGSFVWRVEAGQTTSFPKTLTPGSYPIKCDIHPSMMGTLVVT